MPLLHYLEIENFKTFGSRQRIELAHPAVLTGPAGSGKTSALQALALWSQAVRTWHEARRSAAPRDRGPVPLNRLAIAAVPVRRTRLFWHRTSVRTGNTDIPMTITAGIDVEGTAVPVTMRFRSQGDDLIYARPDDPADMGSIARAAALSVTLLPPVAGLDMEEPLLPPARIAALLGQGHTGQVLRNLCRTVHRTAPDGWATLAALVEGMTGAALGTPEETAHGAIDLTYRHAGIREPLDLPSAGRGVQQILLILAGLFAHRGGVVLLDAPDTHLEPRQQARLYPLLRDIAAEHGTQVILTAGSEIVLNDALDTNLTFLIDGKADDLSRKDDIRASLKPFGTEHYIKARAPGHALYVDDPATLPLLRALAERTGHPVARVWAERINAFLADDGGIVPQNHFDGLTGFMPGLRGLAILGGGAAGGTVTHGGLTLVHWQRHGVANHVVTPDLLTRYTLKDADLFSPRAADVQAVMDALVLEFVFDSSLPDFQTWKESPAKAASLIWAAKTQHRDLNRFAELFFHRLSERTGGVPLLAPGDFHRLVPLADPSAIDPEVGAVLDHLHALFTAPPSP